MKCATLSLLLLAGLAHSAPAPSEDDDRLSITKDLFPDSLKVYTGKHEIVNILVPLNALNFNDDDNDDELGSYIFFVEADVKDGKTYDKGLYVLNNNKATKLLDNGRDAAASNDDFELVFFGAKDGIYVYNKTLNKVEKYGTITDSIIGIAKENGTDTIYILTEDHELFKVEDAGNKKVKVDTVKNAQQIVLDYSNNIYFYGADLKPYVVTSKGIKKIEGLPEKYSYARLIKPPFVIEDGVPFIVDNKAYIIYANGTSELSDFDLEVRPSAYGMEATLIQYYAYNKSIYEYNVLVIMLQGIFEEMRKFLSNNMESIKEIAAKPRSELMSK